MTHTVPRFIEKDAAKRRTYRHDELTLAPLLAYVEESLSSLAEKSGLPRRTVQRDSDRGLTVDRASIYTDALRVNPAEIWSCWPELVIADEEERAAAHAGYLARQRVRQAKYRAQKRAAA